jgi:monoterpene epsilon-lactone hydrolase
VTDLSRHVPSRESVRIARGLRLTLQQLSRVLPASGPVLRLTRATVERVCVATGADRIPHTPVRERVESGQVRGEWVGPAPVPGDRVLYYIHGSAYAVCSPRTHRPLVAGLARRTGRRAFSLDYRLGPEHRFPSAHRDTVRGYRWLLAQGHRAEDIIVAGDSAGGHLSLALCGELRRLGLPMPAGMVLFSGTTCARGTARTRATTWRSRRARTCRRACWSPGAGR